MIRPRTLILVLGDFTLASTQAVLSSFALAFVFTIATATRADDRPNVVIVYADDLGYGDVGCYNPNSKIPTPHADRLAAEGVRLTDAHSSSGICSPSRYALLTGRYHWRKFHGIVNSFGPSVFDSEELTMAEMFRASGYRTACIGKWHLGWNWQAQTGRRHTPLLTRTARAQR